MSTMRDLPICVCFLSWLLFCCFCSQMSLMEHRSGVHPVTAVAWTSNTSTCPKDFTMVRTKLMVFSTFLGTINLSMNF